MNKEEALQFCGNFLNDYKVLIIVVILLMATSLIVVKHWLNSNRMPEFFRSAFEIGRDYKSELQAIVNQHCHYTQGLSWVYGDINLNKWEPGLTSLQKNIHKSYIVAFGNNNIVIIPILVQSDKILGYEPLLITKDKIASLKYSNVLKKTKIQTADIPEAIEYQVLGKMYKSVTFTDMFAEYDEETGQIVQPHDATMSGNTIVSKVNISQEQEQQKYVQFINEFIREIDRKRKAPDK